MVERRRMAEREGFEPPCRLPGKTLSRRPRYDHFGTSPFITPLRAPQGPSLRARGSPAANFPPALACCCRSDLPGKTRRLPFGLRVLTSSFPEELLHHCPAFGLEHATERFHSMVQRRVFVRAHR
jgi:hypothetical protein